MQLPSQARVRLCARFRHCLFEEEWKLRECSKRHVLQGVRKQGGLDVSLPSCQGYHTCTALAVGVLHLVSVLKSISWWLFCV